MRGRGARLVAVCGGIVGIAAASLAADGRLYQWTDGEGVVRYTPDRDRIPRGARDTIEVVEPGAPDPEPNGSPTSPAALPAVMGPKLEQRLKLDPEQAPPEDPAELDQKIRELRDSIAREQATLRQLMAAEKGEGADEWDARITTIANRLPVMQAELKRLEQIQRERSAEPGSAQP